MARKRDTYDGTALCKQCKTRFVFDPAKHVGMPTNCGALACDTGFDVAGKARMAAARKAAGLPLSKLDRKALKEAS